jgi:hypothetical protein
MPSSSKKQHNLMAAVAHNPAFAKKVGIPTSVGKDFAAADKGKRFGMGGSPKITRGGEGMINKQETRRGSTLGYQKGVPDINLDKFEGMKKGGLTVKGANMAKVKKMAKGGDVGIEAGEKATKFGEHAVQQRGKTRGKQIVMSGGKGMKKGGKC